MASHLTWLQAFTLAAEGGRPIRRDAGTRWLYKGPAIWFAWALDGTGAEVFHPVKNTELTSVDMLASDWTDEAWDPTAPVYPPGVCCTPVAASAVPVAAPDPSAPSFCSCADDSAPAGVTTTTPSTTLPTTGTSGAASAPSTTPTPGVGSGAPARFAFRGSGTFGSPINPPAPMAVSGLFWSNPPGPGSSNPPIGPVPQTPPSSDPPVVTVTIIPPTDGDFFAADGRYLSATHDFDPTGDTGAPIVLPELLFHVSIAGGPAGVNFISYTVGGGTPPANDNGYKGFSRDKNGTTISFLPGGTITIAATYTVAGVPYTGAATYTFPGWHGWTAPTSILISGNTSGSTFSFTLTLNGSTSSGDLHTMTATGGHFGVMGSPSTLSMYPGEFIGFFGPTGVTYPASGTLSYDYLGRTIAGTFTIAGDGTVTSTGAVFHSP